MRTKEEARKLIEKIILCAKLEAAAICGNKEEAYEIRQRIYEFVG